MDQAMLGLNMMSLLVYLDDIVVYSTTVGEHLSSLESLFVRLRQVNVKLKPSKCQLLRDTIHFLGHVVNREGVSTDPEKVSAVREWPIPRTVTDVRAFVGLCSYYRKFIEGFADIARPLHQLTGKYAKFDWDEACQQAFDTLKDKLTQSPVLALPQDTGVFILDTDASALSIGAVLSQVQNGVEKPLAFASKLLSKSEINYSITRRELLAVVTYLKHFRHFLLGREFVLRTDHAALQWVHRTPEPIGQQARWLSILEEFQAYTVQHRPGQTHGNADSLS